MATLLLLAGAGLWAPARGFGDVDARPSKSQPVTFSHDIATIVYGHCAACHRDGEAAPFALMNYQQVKTRARRIVELTGRRVMPPWKAEQSFGTFIGDRRLSDKEVDLLRRWNEQGCLEGDAAEMPAPPHFAGGWQLGTPDMIVRMTEAYDLPADGRDVYRCFVIPVEVPAGKYVRAVEFRPENRRIVHHAVLTTLGPEEAAKKLAAEPAAAGPGFASGLAAPGDRLPGPLGIWVPGKDPSPLPDGYAMQWPGPDPLVVQLHLHPSGKPERERSSVGLYFTDQKPRGQLRPVLLFNKEVNIAAGDGNYTMTKSITLPRPVDVIGLFPHMHLLGRSVKTTATLPDGTVRPLLSIADWDFNWQGYYQYASPLRLPAGTRLDAEWTFDNSADNPANPSSPPRHVRFGEQTTDEMGAVILDVIPAK